MEEKRSRGLHLTRHRPVCSSKRGKEAESSLLLLHSRILNEPQSHEKSHVTTLTAMQTLGNKWGWNAGFFWGGLGKNLLSQYRSWIRCTAGVRIKKWCLAAELRLTAAIENWTDSVLPDQDAPSKIIFTWNEPLITSLVSEITPV